MTPIDENDLRAELRFASGAPSPDNGADLAATAISRGRGVRRRRTALAAVAALTVFGGVWGLGDTILRRPVEAVPLAPPTATPTAPAAPTPTPAATVVPADAGTWPAGYLLPGEDRPPTDQTSSFEPAPLEVMCVNGTVELPALEALERSRVRQLTGPEFYEGMGLLMFATEADAGAFLGQVAAGAARCGDAGDPVDSGRTRQASGEVPGLADQSVGVRQWQEREDSPGVWTPAPGGGVQLFAREGRSVAFAARGGDSLGDPGGELAADARLRPLVEAILAQAP